MELDHLRHWARERMANGDHREDAIEMALRAVVEQHAFGPEPINERMLLQFLQGVASHQFEQPARVAPPSRGPAAGDCASMGVPPSRIPDARSRWRKAAATRPELALRDGYQERFRQHFSLMMMLLASVISLMLALRSRYPLGSLIVALALVFGLVGWHLRFGWRFIHAGRSYRAYISANRYGHYIQRLVVDEATGERIDAIEFEAKHGVRRSAVFARAMIMPMALIFIVAMIGVVCMYFKYKN